MDTPKDWKLDVIVPTADENEWPAKESLDWNMYRASVYEKIRFNPIVSSGDSFSFAKSINRGIRESRPDSDILLLNDDCFLDRGWAPKFWAAKRSHPSCGIFGALLRFPTKQDAISHHHPEPKEAYGDLFSGRKAVNHFMTPYQHAGGFIPLTVEESAYAIVRWALWYKAPLWALKALRDLYNNNGSVFPGHYHHMRGNNKIHLVTAAAMMITRDTIDEIGVFDERYVCGFEDTDYCLTAQEKNILPCLVSDAVGSHYETLTTRHLEDVKRDSYRKLIQKWPIERIRKAVKIGITHPAYCGCKDGYE